MANTTAFGWDTPDDTDLVKDGAAAIRELGQDIDTSMADLLGGTTGQVLAKASNTNMDFTWVAQDDSNAIQNAIVDAKGDLIAASAADTPARLAVGTNGQVLTADSTASTGLAWTTPAASGGWTLLNSGSTSLAGLSGTVTFSSISGSYKDLVINIYGVNPSSGTAECLFRLNGDSTSGNYPRFENYMIYGAGTPATAYQGGTGFNLDSWGRSYLQSGTTKNFWRITIPKYALADTKLIQWQDEQNLGGSNTRLAISAAAYLGTSAITSISLVLSTGTFSAGNIEIYGVN